MKLLQVCENHVEHPVQLSFLIKDQSPEPECLRSGCIVVSPCITVEDSEENLSSVSQDEASQQTNMEWPDLLSVPKQYRTNSTSSRTK